MSDRYTKTSKLALMAVALPLIAIMGMGLEACSKGPGAAKGKDKVEVKLPPSPYATIANGKVDVEGGVISVAARRAGVVSEVLVQEGDVVKKGQILARQEDQDTLLAMSSARATVAQAQSQMVLTQVNIATAQREYERLAKLAPDNFVAQQKLDQARDQIATAKAMLGTQQAAVATAQAQLAQAQYNEELTYIRAPMDGKIIRRYANPGAGASTLNVSNMFDLEPAIPHIVRAEIIESSIPLVYVGQGIELVSEDAQDKVYTGEVLRIAPTFGARKLMSDSQNEATDQRVVEVVVTADKAPFLIGQRVLVKFMKRGEVAGAPHAAPTPVAAPTKK